MSQPTSLKIEGRVVIYNRPFSHLELVEILENSKWVRGMMRTTVRSIREHKLLKQDVHDDVDIQRINAKYDIDREPVWGTVKSNRGMKPPEIPRPQGTPGLQETSRS